MVGDLITLNVLGIMSGTSLDGLDMAFCCFSRINSKWQYKLIKATTLPYPEKIKNSLNSSIFLNSEQLCALDHEYGTWIGQQAAKFLNEYMLKADWISSHGHTVFHQPLSGFTLQIGNGNDIASQTGIPVIFDFRSKDISLGGQGAPLVPVGDEYLFENYDYCLNLGGFSNISYKKGNRRIAFDICPVNMGLNYLAGKLGLEFDKDGILGKKGSIIPEILEQLNGLEFYELNPPKSLSREWFTREMEPLLRGNSDVKDILRTLYEHIAIQINRIINTGNSKTVLITGGGARNTFLVELISQKILCNCVIPGDDLIDFKEALIFAFLGYLRVNNIPNVFSSATGSLKDHCGGVICL